MVKLLYVKKKKSDECMKELLAEFLEIDDDYTIIDEDCDVYLKEDVTSNEASYSTLKLIMKFRKNIIPNEYINLVDKIKTAAAQGNSRGAAGGKIDDPTKIMKNATEIYKVQNKHSGFITYKKKDGTIHKSNYKKGNRVKSGPIGYYGKTSAYPCRLVSFSKRYFKKYTEFIPFIEFVDEKFKELLPTQHSQQRERAQLTDYVISSTSFSTVTVNRDFRTAVHVDKGDYEKGFGVISVIKKGNVKGGEFMLPQYNLSVKVESNDLLLVDVHSQYHCNNTLTIEGGSGSDNMRISLVFYLREDIARVCENRVK